MKAEYSPMTSIIPDSESIPEVDIMTNILSWHFSFSKCLKNEQVQEALTWNDVD